MAATKGIELGRSDTSISHLYFFADNPSALEAIFDAKPRGGGQHHTHILKFATTLYIVWCPSHHPGVPGNERADELAKHGTRPQSTNPGQYTKKGKDIHLQNSAKRVAKWAPKTGGSPHPTVC
ncbi:hypothetical protein CVT26_009220 [Gymnopilus dilepis]|uniref:Uncharacterized protein n=1 Tax=Gymnopilus dilepis TaxID=231916 RepID=A0A409WCF0_9AGAR|nr:hypothetical protein CVT26_009220 [Gymnopilus dilepis]